MFGASALLYSISESGIGFNYLLLFCIFSYHTVCEQNKNLGGFSFFNDPEVVFKVADSIPYEEDGSYVLSDSSYGRQLLSDSSAYYSDITNGNYYKVSNSDLLFSIKKSKPALVTQSGTASISVSYASIGVYQIIFDEPFAEIPTVSVKMVTGGNIQNQAISNITVGGFKVSYNFYINGTATIEWYAVGKPI